jgi:hypothetical protein
MFERYSGIFLVAGIGFFTLAFVSNGVVPVLMYADQPEKTAEEMVNPRIMVQLQDLHDNHSAAFEKYIGEVSEANCAQLLREGRRVYIGEGCWHCHSQFVRPVANEEKRWGPVSESWEYQNELQRPVMFGTRRVGPDLTREYLRRGNDWHMVHFFRPRMASPESVMPDYPWFFDDNRPSGPGSPNRRGFAIILYMQWLGSWREPPPPQFVGPRAK